MSSNQNYSVEEIRQILNEIIKSIAFPDNNAKLKEAKEAAGNEMLKMMQIVFPVVIEIEMDVIKDYGFAGGREGMVHFTQIVRDFESIDPEIAKLHSEIRSNFLPPVAITSQFENTVL